MQPVIWSPFRDMEDLFSSLRRGGQGLPVSKQSAELSNWAPAVDISETDKAYLVKGELPGVSKDDVKIDLHNGVLTLSGERRFEKEDKDEKHHRIERSYGSFSRSFQLPENVDEAAIEAEFRDGLITVRLPKVAAKAPGATRIPVK